MQKKHYLTVSLLLSPMIALSVDSTSAFSESTTSTKDTAVDVKQDAKAADAATGNNKEEKKEGSQSNKENQVDPKQAAKDKKAVEKQAAKDAKQAEMNAQKELLNAYVDQARALATVIEVPSQEVLLAAAAHLDAQTDQKAEELVSEVVAIVPYQPRLSKDQFDKEIAKALKNVQKRLTTVVDPVQRQAVLDKFIAKLHSMHADAVKQDAAIQQKGLTQQTKPIHARYIAAEQTIDELLSQLTSDDQKAAMLKDYKKMLTEQSFRELVGEHPTTALVTAGLAAAGVAGAAVYLYEQGVVRAALDLADLVANTAYKNAAQLAQDAADTTKQQSDVVAELFLAASKK